MTFKSALEKLMHKYNAYLYRCKGKHPIYKFPTGQMLQVSKTPSRVNAIKKIERNIVNMLNPDHPYNGLGIAR